MSDTPRTDAQACHVSVDRAGCILLWYSKDGGYVPRLLSEQLERQNAALRQDKERLDWLEEGHAWPEYIDAEWHSKGQVFLSFRDAIDAAAKEGQP
jgi:hypothetical protein